MTLQEILAKGKQYTLVFLKKGPHYDILDPKELQQNQTQHLEYLLGLRAKGILSINGPVTDEKPKRRTKKQPKTNGTLKPQTKKKEAEKDLSKTYDEFKEFEGQHYTGM